MTRLRHSTPVALVLAAALACATEPASDRELWQVAAQELARRRADWDVWESIAVDSIAVGHQALARVLGLTVVRRPNDLPVPCPVRAVPDGIPDASLYINLSRYEADSATALVIVVCDFHDGVRVRSSIRSFTVHLARGWFGWGASSVSEE